MGELLHRAKETGHICLIICLNKFTLSCFFPPQCCWLLSVTTGRQTEMCEAKKKKKKARYSREVEQTSRRQTGGHASSASEAKPSWFRVFQKGGTYDRTLIQTARCIQVVKAGELCRCIHLSGGEEGNTNTVQSGLGSARQTRAARQISHSPLTTRPGASGATQKEWII